MAEEKRMRLRGLHHVTAICADAERAIAFYRDVLGMGIVRDGPSDDDPAARHVWFGAGGTTGSLVSLMEYPALPEAVVGRGATHHFALLVGSREELEAWSAYLPSRGVECSDILQRGGFASLYARDPDGHVVELTTPAP